MGSVEQIFDNFDILKFLKDFFSALIKGEGATSSVRSWLLPAVRWC